MSGRPIAIPGRTSLARGKGQNMTDSEVGGILGDWISRLAGELGIDPTTVPTQLVLDLARDSAHGIARPAAPVTTFLIGLAAGQRGGDPNEIAAAAATAQRLIAQESTQH